MENNNSQYNEYELHAPQWLNKEFFEKVLQNYNNCNTVQVNKFEITPGAGKGDHYASIMFRVKINYTINDEESGKCISLIVKTEPEIDSKISEIMGELTFFETEILMYSQILPKMTQLLREAGDDTKLSPKMVYSQNTPRRCIIFEDLIENGYTTVAKRSCTLEEVTEVIGILARIHAISYKLYQEGNTDMPKPKSFFTKELINKSPFMREGFAYCKDIAANDDNLKQYIPKFNQIEDSLLDDIASFFNENDFQKRGNIMVLNHGDFHSKNIMVNYKENILKNVILLDYQACYYGSPVLDLMNAFVMMYSPESRLKHHEKIFSEYIKTFQQTLKMLNFNGNIPTKVDFEEEWKKYKRWELFILMNFMLFTYSMLNEKIAAADVMEKPEVRKQIWQDESFLMEIRKQISRLANEGYFD